MKTSFLHDPRVRVDERGRFKLKDHPSDIDTSLEKKDLKKFLDQDRELIAEQLKRQLALQRAPVLERDDSR